MNQVNKIKLVTKTSISDIHSIAFIISVRELHVGYFECLRTNFDQSCVLTLNAPMV